ncbi:MBL fold metallo-hydrolase [Haliangium sp.]|uniref:MBL fold metallo-hydrolase n=1 Tax=Haliangium sp. TaxID=2663208 RepID=UPI003D0E34AB
MSTERDLESGHSARARGAGEAADGAGGISIDDIYRQARAAAPGASAADREAPPVLEVLGPGVARCVLRTPTLPPATHTNCYVVGDRELVIIDPASPYPDQVRALDEVIDALAAAGRHVVEIWLTHHHGDHVGGAEHLARRLGVPVAAHPATAERLGLSVELVLEDGHRRSLAGEPTCVLTCMYTPGHAPGHLCFFEAGSRDLIAGDMVAGVGTILIDPSEGHMGQYLGSLARMKAARPARLLPAHGEPITDPGAKIDAYVHHRRWREERVATALASHGPATSRALVAHAYADVPAAIHPMAERSLLAHLVKLVEDGRAERSGDTWRAVTE